MSLILSEIIDIVEGVAPKELKEDYDNVGLMVGEKQSIINSVLIALDCTLEVMQEAIEKNCELILCHHPLLFNRPSSITDSTLLGRKIRTAIKNNLNIYAAHTNLDSAEDGLNDLITHMLGFHNSIVMERNLSSREGFADGIGRLVELEIEKSLVEVCNEVKQALGLEHLRYSGNSEWKIKKLAIINGSGQDFFHKAVSMGADCIITGDTTYHYVSDLYEEGIAVIDAGHFGTEWPAMKSFAVKFKNMLKQKGLSLEVLISEKNFDPYKML